MLPFFRGRRNFLSRSGGSDVGGIGRIGLALKRCVFRPAVPARSKSPWGLGTQVGPRYLILILTLMAIMEVGRLTVSTQRDRRFPAENMATVQERPNSGWPGLNAIERMSGETLSGVQCGSPNHLIPMCPNRFERRDEPHGVREARENGCGANSGQVKNVSAEALPRLRNGEEVKAEAPTAPC